jgi:hypothetical protein
VLHGGGEGLKENDTHTGKTWKEWLSEKATADRLQRRVIPPSEMTDCVNYWAVLDRIRKL